jgi:hypothetical protein
MCRRALEESMRWAACPTSLGLVAAGRQLLTATNKLGLSIKREVRKLKAVVVEIFTGYRNGGRDAASLETSHEAWQNQGLPTVAVLNLAPTLATTGEQTLVIHSTGEAYTVRATGYWPRRCHSSLIDRLDGLPCTEFKPFSLPFVVTRAGLVVLVIFFGVRFR